MAHPEDDPAAEEEPEYWTPEEEAERDPEARLHKVLDKTEKHLEALRKEVVRPLPEFQLEPLPTPRAQIEIRIISNGFVMSFSRAKLIPFPGYPFPVYRPEPEETFLAGPSSAGAALAMAMESATLLADCLKRMEEYDARHPQPPRGAPQP